MKKTVNNRIAQVASLLRKTVESFAFLTDIRYNRKYAIMRTSQSHHLLKMYLKPLKNKPTSNIIVRLYY